MSNEPILSVHFFLTSNGKEPVRDWLKEMVRENRRTIGEDVKLVQFRWPLGMPLVRKMEADLWEVRSKLSNNTIARTFFTVTNNQMILLHGIIKKSEKTPKNDLDLARSRKKQWHNEARK